MDQGLGIRGWGLAISGWGLVGAFALSVACAPAPQTDKTPKAGSEMSRAVVDPY